MKTIYFDCNNGISGNSLLGALFDCGYPFDLFKKQMTQLLPNDDFSFTYQQNSSFNLFAVYFDTIIKNEEDEYRNIDAIFSIIEASNFSSNVKNNAIEIFKLLAQALASAHQCSIDEVIFHEKKAIDTMIDVVGVCLGFEYLGCTKFLCSPLHVGSGSISYRYGTLEIPAPATKYLIKQMPTYQTSIIGELVTPTAAAILNHFVYRFNNFPIMKVECVGYGMPIPNMNYPGYLKVFIGEQLAKED